MSKNNASLWSEIGWPILRDWGPDRKQVVYLIHGGIREFVTWKCKEHGVKIMDVLANPKRKCWVLESEFLEASAILHKILKQG